MSIEKNLWDAANQLRANSGLKSSEYSYPVLGLIFLKYADYKFTFLEKELALKMSKRNRTISKEDYLAKGAMYLNDKVRFKYLLELSEEENIGQKLNEAMLIIEKDNPDLKGILPKNYNKFSNSLLIELFRLMDGIPNDIEGDIFGKVYENFLGEFAMSEGRKGGEFFTPTSIVKLIVEFLEPFKGRIYDPACGSGGMFVQSALFVQKHKSNPTKKISIYGQEKEENTMMLNKMNLAVHGLNGDIKQGISYYDDLHESINKFDYVMANPPFNVTGVKKEKIINDKRYIFGIPKTDNANYLWIQIFLSALNKNGRAGFVMANAANDSGHSELEIRKKIINTKVVDVVVSIGNNFFHNVTLPCSLWFFDKKKINTNRKRNILFIDARNIYNQIDRAHREFTVQHIELISNIARVYRKEKIKNHYISKKEFFKKFIDIKRFNIPGLCRMVGLDEIKEKNWSLNPGQYIKSITKVDNNENFSQELIKISEEFDKIITESDMLEKKIKQNISQLLKINENKKK